MSKISQIFHSNNNSQENIAVDAAAPVGAAPAAPQPIEKAAAAVDGLVDAAAISPIDQLKPKLAELVKEVVAEQEKLVSEVKKFNLEEHLRKLPVIPKCAKRLPDPIKNQIKKVLAQIDGAEKKMHIHEVENAVSDAVPVPELAQ